MNIVREGFRAPPPRCFRTHASFKLLILVHHDARTRAEAHSGGSQNVLGSAVVEQHDAVFFFEKFYYPAQALLRYVEPLGRLRDRLGLRRMQKVIKVLDPHTSPPPKRLHHRMRRSEKRSTAIPPNRRRKRSAAPVVTHAAPYNHTDYTDSTSNTAREIEGHRPQDERV